MNELQPHRINEVQITQTGCKLEDIDEDVRISVNEDVLVAGRPRHMKMIKPSDITHELITEIKDKNGYTLLNQDKIKGIKMKNGSWEVYMIIMKWYTSY